MDHLPETLAALGVFGMIFVCPLVYMLTKHQRAMAELLHGSKSNETAQRLEMVERELRELKAMQHMQILRQEDTLRASSLQTPPDIRLNG